MFAAVRRRLCYANVVATLALVFAMSGGALAAGHYLLTSTGQISPKVLKTLKGKAGPTGTPGAQGPQGPKGETGAAGAPGAAGAKGEAGAKGATGATGANGARGAVGATGATGASGSPWTAGGTLPNGSTETGTWATSGPANDGPVRIALASFTVPLAEPPTVTVIGPEEGQDQAKENEKAKQENEERKLNGEPELPLPIPTDCKGKAGKPEAVAGNLCIFEYYAEHVTAIKTGELVSTAGAIAKVIHSEEEPFQAVGTWAVTAK
jgi:Collagen triple helix repeat (20 copies)